MLEVTQGPEAVGVRCRRSAADDQERFVRILDYVQQCSKAPKNRQEQ